LATGGRKTIVERTNSGGRPEGTGKGGGTAIPLARALVGLDVDLHPIFATGEFLASFATTPGTLPSTVRSILQALPGGPDGLRGRAGAMLSGSADAQSIQWQDSAGRVRSLVLIPAAGWWGGTERTMLIMEEVADRGLLAQHLAERLEHSELMIEEMHHRLANTLQIVASLLRIKAHLVQSDDARRHLEDMHQRVAAIADLQEEVEEAREGTVRSVTTYLTSVCTRLERSLVDPDSGIQLRVEAVDLPLSPEKCVALGLVVMELVINALKHAFPRPGPGLIRVIFAPHGTGWRLSVIDNGVGIDPGSAPGVPGTGTRIIRNLAARLGATLELSKTEPCGLSVHLTCSGLPDGVK